MQLHRASVRKPKPTTARLAVQTDFSRTEIEGAPPPHQLLLGNTWREGAFLGNFLSHRIPTTTRCSRAGGASPESIPDHRWDTGESCRDEFPISPNFSSHQRRKMRPSFGYALKEP